MVLVTQWWLTQEWFSKNFFGELMTEKLDLAEPALLSLLSALITDPAQLICNQRPIVLCFPVFKRRYFK